ADHLVAVFRPPSLGVAPCEEVPAGLPVVRGLGSPLCDDGDFAFGLRLLYGAPKLSKFTTPRLLAPLHPLEERTVTDAGIGAGGLVIVPGGDGVANAFRHFMCQGGRSSGGHGAVLLSGLPLLLPARHWGGRAAPRSSAWKGERPGICTCRPVARRARGP